jgi:hypothetical protein
LRVGPAPAVEVDRPGVRGLLEQRAHAVRLPILRQDGLRYPVDCGCWPRPLARRAIRYKKPIVRRKVFDAHLEGPERRSERRECRAHA